MGEFASGRVLTMLAWITAATVVSLNGVFLFLQAGEWAEDAAHAGWSPLWVYGTLGPVSAGLVGFLGWLALYPLRLRREAPTVPMPAPALPAVRYRRIGVAVEFVPGDEIVLTQAAALARAHDAELLLLHVVEGAGADLYGSVADDAESRSDRRRLAELVAHLRDEGLSAQGELGYGEPAKELLRLAKEGELHLLVLGTHGHRLLSDLALGQTVLPLLHRSAIPILVVPAHAGRAPGRRPEMEVRPPDHD
jgi:manganese transport protein